MSYRAPTQEELKSPLFNRIWEATKDWDVRTPEHGGYMGVTGNHVCEIMDAVKAASEAERAAGVRAAAQHCMIRYEDFFQCSCGATLADVQVSWDFAQEKWQEHILDLIPQPAAPASSGPEVCNCIIGVHMRGAPSTGPSSKCPVHQADAQPASAAMKCPKCGMDVFAHGETCPAPTLADAPTSALEQEIQRDIPLCANHAETWFCERNHLPLSDCVVCAMSAAPAPILGELEGLREAVQGWANNCAKYEVRSIALDAVEYHRGAKEAYQRIVETLDALIKRLGAK